MPLWQLEVRVRELLVVVVVLVRRPEPLARLAQRGRSSKPLPWRCRGGGPESSEQKSAASDADHGDRTY